MEWRVYAPPGGTNQQELRLFVGSDMHTTTPSLVLSGDLANSVTAIEDIAYGVGNACNGTVYMDQTALGVQDWVGATANPAAFPLTAIAGFTVDTLTVAKGGRVKFKNYSTGNPTSYRWIFGDGSGSGISPPHTYSLGGTYNVELTATNTSGTSPAATLTITALDPARGKVIPKIAVGSGSSAIWKTEGPSGGLVRVRRGVSWVDAQPRVFKGGLWSSNESVVGGDTTGWGVGTNASGVWYGCSPGQPGTAQESYDLAKVSFGQVDIVHEFNGKWSDTWSTVTAGAKLSEPKVVALTVNISKADFQIISEGTQPQKDNLYQRMVTFCKSIPSTKRLWLTANHEPEDDLGNANHYAYPYLTISTWRTAQRMMQDAVVEARAARTTNKQWLKYHTVLMGWTFDPASGRDITNWVIDNVDAWGFDAYHLSSLRIVRKYAQDAGKNWLIPEWGDSNSDDITMRDWMLAYWREATTVGTLRPRSLMYWQARDANTGWNAIITPTTHPRSCELWTAICTTGRPPDGL
jgi:PKD repeat protein